MNQPQQDTSKEAAEAEEKQRFFKVKEISGTGKLRLFASMGVYRALNYGRMPVWKCILAEIVFSTFGWMPGAAGLLSRSKLYPLFFRSIGKKVVFGRNVIIRHPHKISIGHRVIIDDNCVVDAKGEDNDGIRIGDDVFIGRNTIMYTKNGNMRIGNNVSVSSNCQFVSSNDMTIGADTVIGGYSYIVSGGGYDYSLSAPRFSHQDGFITSGPLTIGENCWLGARITVLDGVHIGDHCVLAAGAVVTESLSDKIVAGGVPARKIKTIDA